MQLARNQVQHAYLLNCLDSELYLCLTSSIAATTPVLGTRDWKVSECIFLQNWKVSESESVRIGKCQNRKVSELESVRIGKCQNWKASELESVRIEKCQSHLEFKDSL